MYIFPLEQNQYYQNYAFREKFFSPEECDRVLGLLKQYPLQDAVVQTNESLKYAGEIRKSRVTFLPWVQELSWVFQRLASGVLEANKSLYNFNLAGFTEGLQLAEYANGAFFDWHQDSGRDAFSIRKLSIVVQLTDGKSYEGGDLEFIYSREAQRAVRTRGALILFPSYVVHRVTPLTAGVRHSLVGWVSGPPFR